MNSRVIFYVIAAVFYLFAPDHILSQVKKDSQNTGDPRNPYTPTMEMLNDSCSIEALDLVRIKKGDPDGYDTYFHEGYLYSGWACSVNRNSNHRYRYTRYENGIPVRQIGFYASGTLDHDYQMAYGKGMGSQRMWHSNGTPYIDNFYSRPGIKDGLQKRWYINRKLAQVSLFEHGKRLYEIIYDTEGNIIETSGEVPFSN